MFRVCCSITHLSCRKFYLGLSQKKGKPGLYRETHSKYPPFGGSNVETTLKGDVHGSCGLRSVQLQVVLFPCPMTGFPIRAPGLLHSFSGGDKGHWFGVLPCCFFPFLAKGTFLSKKKNERKKQTTKKQQCGRHEAGALSPTRGLGPSHRAPRCSLDRLWVFPCQFGTFRSDMGGG